MIILYLIVVKGEIGRKSGIALILGYLGFLALFVIG
jgi:hypothetical protein